MDWSLNRNRWRKRTHRHKPLLLFFLPAILVLLFLFSYSNTLRSLLPFAAPLHSTETLIIAPPQCRLQRSLPGDRFLWYAPHSGFTNQVFELKNALILASILNRTLIVPPVLDHHAVALGSCPKFRVSSPSDLRAAVWDHIMDLARSRRYVSMADIVDLSTSVGSMVKTIDFRVFASTWCGLNMDTTCFGSLCCSVSRIGFLPSNPNQCRSLLSGLRDNIDRCTYAVQEDCRSTVWTYQPDKDGILDSFQLDKELQKKKKLSFVRKRRDVYKTLGPGSKADSATVLSFGSLFSAPYRGSELHIDIHEAPHDPCIQSLIQKIEFLPFVPEIIQAGKEFAMSQIKEPFLCAQLRLLDGQFKNHWKATFSALEQKVQSLKASGPIHIFIMTDLSTENWTGTYLGNLAKDTFSYKLHALQESEDLVVETAKRLMEAEHGLRSGFLPSSHGVIDKKGSCEPVLLPDILLYIEESVCSCASLGFVGTAGSTIAESIESMRKYNVCKL